MTEQSVGSRDICPMSVRGGALLRCASTPDARYNSKSCRVAVGCGNYCVNRRFHVIASVSERERMCGASAAAANVQPLCSRRALTVYVDSSVCGASYVTHVTELCNVQVRLHGAQGHSCLHFSSREHRTRRSPAEIPYSVLPAGPPRDATVASTGARLSAVAHRAVRNINRK